MDFSNHVLNFIFIVGIFIVFAISVSTLIRAVASGNTTLMVLAGAFVFALVVGTALFWSDGYIRTTMSEKFISLFTTSASSVATAFSPTATTPQPINIQVAMPEQAPPTVVVQTPAPENSTVHDNSASTSAEAEESAPTQDRSDIFDLGSDIDGYFPDGTPYKTHRVESGDTIYNIRTRNSLSEAELLNRNPDLDIRRPIVIGQEIKIPLPLD